MTGTTILAGAGAPGWGIAPAPARAGVYAMLYIVSGIHS